MSVLLVLRIGCLEGQIHSHAAQEVDRILLSPLLRLSAYVEWDADSLVDWWRTFRRTWHDMTFRHIYNLQMLAFLRRGSQMLSVSNEPVFSDG